MKVDPYKITYVRYNNKDLTGTAFAETIEDAEMIQERLRRLHHVSDVRIAPATPERK